MRSAGTFYDGAKLADNWVVNTNTTLELSAAHSFPLSQLSRAGTVAANFGQSIIAGGAISPGDSIGTLNMTGNFALVDGAKVDIEVDNFNGSPGTNWDFIEGITATFEFADINLSSDVRIRLKTVDAMGIPGPMENFDQNSSSTIAVAGDSLTLTHLPIPLTCNNSKTRTAVVSSRQSWRTMG